MRGHVLLLGHKAFAKIMVHIFLHLWYYRNEIMQFS